MTWTTEVYQFNPTYTSNQSYSWTFDGSEYSSEIRWHNKQYWVHLYDSTGTLILCKPLVSSTSPQNINSASWNNGTVTVEFVSPHRLTLFSVVRLHIFGCDPSGYDGIYDAFVTGPQEISYPLSAIQTNISVSGFSAYEHNIIENYFSASSRLIYKADTSTFEVWTYTE